MRQIVELRVAGSPPQLVELGLDFSELDTTSASPRRRARRPRRIEVFEQAWWSTATSANSRGDRGQAHGLARRRGGLAAVCAAALLRPGTARAALSWSPSGNSAKVEGASIHRRSGQEARRPGADPIQLKNAGSAGARTGSRFPGDPSGRSAAAGRTGSRSMIRFRVHQLRRRRDGDSALFSPKKPGQRSAVSLRRRTAAATRLVITLKTAKSQALASRLSRSALVATLDLDGVGRLNLRSWMPAAFDLVGAISSRWCWRSRRPLLCWRSR